MIFKHCANCQKLTGHKRAFGAGTVIGFLFTFGLWIFAMPFYPIRCSVCGMEIGLKEAGTGQDAGNLHVRTGLLPKMSAVAIFLSGLFILLFTVIGYLLGNFFPFQLVALVMGGILIFAFCIMISITTSRAVRGRIPSQGSEGILLSYEIQIASIDGVLKTGIRDTRMESGRTSPRNLQFRLYPSSKGSTKLGLWPISLKPGGE